MSPVPWSYTTLLVFLCTVIIISASSAIAAPKGQAVLTLLNVLPFPDRRSSAGFEGGHELVPAANLAVEQINNRSDLLAGYTLEAVTVDSEPCGVSVINNGLVNTYAGLVDSGRLVVGVVGLFCAGVTDVVSSLATLPLFDRLQISGSTSSKQRDIIKFPRLYHAVSSSALFGEAMVNLMFKFGWERIGLVHDSNGVGFQTTADDFAKLVANILNFELATRIAIDSSSLPQVTNGLIRARARIAFLPVTVQEAANVLCEAFKNNALWPNFVHIFEEVSVNVLLQEETLCTCDEMIAGIEGAFFLDIQTEVDANTLLVSGLTYKEYWNEYAQLLHQLEFRENLTLNPGNTLANVAHDQIWAFSLALNNSLDLLHSVNRTIEDYQTNQSLVSDIIEEQLLSVRFQGAAGYFELNDNREAASSISLSQVQNGTPVLVGLFDPQRSDSIIFITNVSNVPDDDYEDVFAFLPLSIVIPMSVICLIGLASLALLLILFLCYRKRPEIKASSPYLSIIMFIACLMLYGSVCMQILGVAGIGIGIVCNLDLWLVAIGLNLMFGTIFMRLLRIYYVFKTFRETGRFWSDRYLVIGIFALLSGIFILLVTAAIVDPFREVQIKTFIADANPPYFQVNAVCHARYVLYWVFSGLAYNGTILFLAAVFAFRTRRIRREEFKDTKKVTAFVYLNMFVFIFGILVTYVLRFQLSSAYGSIIAAIVSRFLQAVLCEVLVLAPKVLPILFASKSTGSKKSQQRNKFQSRSRYVSWKKSVLIHRPLNMLPT